MKSTSSTQNAVKETGDKMYPASRVRTRRSHLVWSCCLVSICRSRYQRLIRSEVKRRSSSPLLGTRGGFGRWLVFESIDKDSRSGRLAKSTRHLFSAVLTLKGNCLASASPKFAACQALARRLWRSPDEPTFPVDSHSKQN